MDNVINIDALERFYRDCFKVAVKYYEEHKTCITCERDEYSTELLRLTRRVSDVGKRLGKPQLKQGYISSYDCVTYLKRLM